MTILAQNFPRIEVGGSNITLPPCDSFATLPSCSPGWPIPKDSLVLPLWPPAPSCVSLFFAGMLSETHGSGRDVSVILLVKAKLLSGGVWETHVQLVFCRHFGRP